MWVTNSWGTVWLDDSTSQFKEKEMESFYMCYVQGKRSPTYCHATLGDAEREAERLARLPDNVGCKVWVLKAFEHCEVATVNWTKSSELPF